MDITEKDTHIQISRKKQTKLALIDAEDYEMTKIIQQKIVSTQDRLYFLELSI